MVDRTIRRNVPVEHSNEREHRRQLAEKVNAALSKDGTDGMTAPLKLKQYAAADLPTASEWTGTKVYISDEATTAYSDGSTWQRTVAGSDPDLPANIITTQGDLIIGTTGGDPTRLAAGTSGQLLQTNGASADPAWVNHDWTVVAKASDEARNTNTTLTSDAALTFAVAASTKYRFRGVVFYNTPAAADFKVQFTGPAAPTLFRVVYTFLDDEVTPSIQLDTAFSASEAYLSTATNMAIQINGILQNGSNAGSVTFQWAQNTSSGSNTTVYAGSYLEYATV